MSGIVFTSRQSILAMLSNAARRAALVVALAAVALISAPFVNPPQREPEIIPLTPARPQSQSRVGVTLRSGDTLLGILKRFGLEAPSAHALIEKIRPLVNVRKIQPGHDVHVVLNGEDKSVEGMDFILQDEVIRVKATNDGWLAERREIPFVTQTRTLRGTIKNNLFESGTDAGLSPQQIMDLANIFASQIDFFSDVHPGDDFNVILEERRYADGRRGAGRIISAELQAEKDFFDAFYFVSQSGDGDYYNSKGEALRRLFLRAPLSYARISSPFSSNRLHPIFRTVRPHLAIDYAAPAGTPVVAIGRGKVDFVGWRNGYGKVVDIRHSEIYSSRYAHFSRFATNLHKGQIVEAGEVIGFVGQTGHATGPHLHFEFLRGGTKINFLTLRIPHTQQLAGEELLRFKDFRDEQLAMLQQRKSRVAQNTQTGF